jgi:hypothetical protein
VLHDRAFVCFDQFPGEGNESASARTSDPGALAGTRLASKQAS